jgi:hypothetical protein
VSGAHHLLPIDGHVHEEFVEFSLMSITGANQVVKLNPGNGEHSQPIGHGRSLDEQFEYPVVRPRRVTHVMDFVSDSINCGHGFLQADER